MHECRAQINHHLSFAFSVDGDVLRRVNVYLVLQRADAMRCRAGLKSCWSPRSQVLHEWMLQSISQAPELY